MSADNNLMILVELIGLSYRYGTTIYAVGGVNRSMCGKFSVGFKVINERATTDDVYAQMLQNLKRTRAAVRSSISKASTISDEEHQLTLTEDDFLTIQ